MSKNKEMVNMWGEYCENDATHIFALAYTEKSKPSNDAPVFVSLVPRDETINYLKTDKKSSSHGGGLVLRFKPDMTQKLDMYACFGRFELASYETVQNTLAMLRTQAANGEIIGDSGKTINPRAINRGHAIEYLLCERWGIIWNFDNASHSTCGDITREGIEYQVKFQGASL